MLARHLKKQKGQLFPTHVCTRIFDVACRIDEWTEKELLDVIHLNAIFPFPLPPVLLPQLRATHGPTTIIFVGSISADIPIPRFGIYGSSKNFVEALSR